jgi:diacylglycerol diphosphate phosphatase/phosphatidate phosphatase
VLCMLQRRRMGGEVALEPSPYTIKSHGASLARNHRQDWIILVLLLVIEVILNVIRPFHRFVGKDMMTDLKYPLKDNSVPVWAVPVSPLSFHN